MAVKKLNIKFSVRELRPDSCLPARQAHFILCLHVLCACLPLGRFVWPTHGAIEKVVLVLYYLLIVFFFYYRNNNQHNCQSLSLNIGTTPMYHRDPPLHSIGAAVNYQFLIHGEPFKPAYRPGRCRRRRRRNAFSP